MIKKVCYFGFYDTNYSRTKEFLRGFAENGVEVIECHVDPTEYPGIRKYSALLKHAWALRKENFDAVIVGYPGHTIVWIARLIFLRKPLIFDVFVSLYDSNVHDRKVHQPQTLHALKDYLLDWYSCALADQLIFDTEQHAKYFQDRFHIPQQKCHRLFIGTDLKLFSPQSRNSSAPPYIIYFQGNFIPLQGVEYIIEAATLMKNDPVLFRIVGSGQTYTQIREEVQSLGLTTIEFLGHQPLTELPRLIASSDICLGIFGASAKTQRVIPNKVYEYLAMGKPIITADTPAIRELLVADHHAALCEAAHAQSIVSTIRRLIRDASLREGLAQNATQLTREKLTSRLLIKGLLEELEYFC